MFTMYFIQNPIVLDQHLITNTHIHIEYQIVVANIMFFMSI